MPLSVLESPYKNFPSDRIFSIYRPLSDGGESMQISAPFPEMGAPKVGKMWGLVQAAYAQFCPVFWLVHSVSEVLSACKILDGGITPSLKYGDKNMSAVKPILRHGRPAVDDQWRIVFHTPAARTLTSVWSVSLRPVCTCIITLSAVSVSCGSVAHCRQLSVLLPLCTEIFSRPIFNQVTFACCV